MSAQVLDWLVAGFAVVFAAAWLGFHIRGVLRRRKDTAGSVGACGNACGGCPYEKGCGGKPG